MKLSITAVNEDLRKALMSESFRMVNYEDPYGIKSQTAYLNMQDSPANGDYLYFYGNYYEQYCVVVDKIVKNGNTSVIYCLPASLDDIDPYMYFENKASKDFKQEVINTYKSYSKALDANYNKKKIEYGNDCSKIYCYAHKIIEFMHYAERTAVDFTNVTYVVCQILHDEDSEFFGEWHKPGRHEYADM